jgi:hypothetical protein
MVRIEASFCVPKRHETPFPVAEIGAKSEQIQGLSHLCRTEGNAKRNRHSI